MALIRYEKISCFENKRRVKLLEEFRSNIVGWFATVEVGGPMDMFYSKETTESSNMRRQINLMIQEVELVIACAFVSTHVYYSPPPAIGGVAGPIDLIQNFPQFHKLKLPEETLLDVVDKSIGVYKTDFRNALIRTINPFFWFGQFAEYLVNIPLKWLLSLGILNKEKAEASLFVKLFKGIGKATIWIAALVLPIVFEKLGWIEVTADWAKNLLK